jgi:hypothetical protein
MSQRDLVAELRSAHIEAPTEVRERVRLIAAGDVASRPPRVTWRRALVVIVPVAAAVAATIVFTRPTHTSQKAYEAQTAPTVQHGFAARSAGTPVGAPARVHSPTLKSALTPAPARGRVQHYGAYLALRVPTPDGVSTALKQAIHVATSLGGYASSVHANARAKSATADLVLKVPRSHVQALVTRLSRLGTITGEQVDIQDLSAGLNATGRMIARDQRTLALLRTQPQTDTVQRQIAALTARIARLQRASAETRRVAHFATVQLRLATPQATRHVSHHGPLHSLRVALRWIGIGLVYLLVLGTPLLLLALLVRWIRRRREDALLSS